MQSECIADATFPVGRNIALLNGFSAARSALFLLPVVVPYFGDHVGLSFRETLLTEAAFAATMVLTEVPSGWLAGHWRRKNVLSTMAYLLSGICALALVEPPRHRVYRGRFDLSAMIQVVLQECRYNRVVLWVVLFAGGLMAATKASVWTQQAYLLLLDVDLFWFGPITAAALLVGGLVSLFEPSIDRSIGASAALGIVVAGVVAGFVPGGSLPSTWMVPILFVAFAAYGIAHPALKALVNDRGSSDRRATILSVLSLVPQLSFVGLSPFVGRIVDDRGADSGYLFLAGFAAISAGAAWYGLAR